MRRMLKVVLLSLLLSAMAMGGAPPAAAFDRGDMGTISPTSGPIEKSFPAIAATMPANGYTLKVNYVPANCGKPASSQAAYCDTHKFHVDTGGHDSLHFVRITLTWADPVNNNLDIYLWPDSTVTGAGAQKECCGAQATHSNHATKYPEVLKLGEPDNKNVPNNPDDDPTLYEYDETLWWITVINQKGANTGGYKLLLEFGFEDLGEYPTFGRPGGGGGSGDFGGGSKSTGSKSTSFNPSNSEPPPEQTEKVKVPGPDGELIEVEVPVLGAQAVRRQQEQRSPLVWIIAAVLVLGFGTFGFLFLRKRRHAAEAAY
ncbi:MAG TPA: hypothetical protein VND22_01405 [Actinomycetota bacterium]|nr:hypothetical protein [Actinomycetota bacterium]